MDLNYLKKIFKIFDESSASDLEIEEEGIKLRISKNNENKAIDSSMYHNPVIHMQPFYQQMPQVPNIQQPVEQATETKEIIEEEVVAKAETQETLHELKSPIVGTFYRAPSPDSDPFIDIGTHVTKGTTLCIVEAMKLMNEIESDINGTIVKILIENAQPVEYNQAMFIIKPD